MRAWACGMICLAASTSCRSAPPRPANVVAVEQPPPPSCRFVLENVSVTAEPDGASHRIFAYGVDATVEVPSYRAEVTRPLAFRGRVEPIGLFDLKHAKDLGGLSLAAGSVAVQAHAGTGRLLEADVELPMEPGSNVTIRGVAVACDELVQHAFVTRNDASISAPSGVPRILERDTELRPKVDSGPSPIRLAGSGLVLFETETRGGLSHVVRAWTNGTRIDGWVATDALREPTYCEWRTRREILGERTETIDTTVALGESCGSGGNAMAGPGLWTGNARGDLRLKRSRVVVATVIPGTPVYATPGGRQWATTADAELTVEVPKPDATWVRLLSDRVVGSDPEDGAWVPRAAVRLP
ncbi:hypothetical protein AKJ09_11057 [Labilithrix luteola]|uniref:Lipoprotein n=1 Tax=Labilithrix luteola TaxID=1391654 RepID=A0A0K1QF55_9BACT|nr:hypothetical protein AKJ09_11057 [Labilithrix luteola]